MKIFKVLFGLLVLGVLVSALRPGVTVVKTYGSEDKPYTFKYYAWNKTTNKTDTVYIGLKNNTIIEPETYCYDKATIHRIYQIKRPETAPVCQKCCYGCIDEVKDILNLTGHQNYTLRLEAQDLILDSPNNLLLPYVNGGFELNLSKFKVEYLSNKTNNTVIKLIPLKNVQ